MKKINIKEIIALAALITIASGCGTQTIALESTEATTEATLFTAEETEAVASISTEVAEELMGSVETTTTKTPNDLSVADTAASNAEVTGKEKVTHFYSEEHKNDRRSGNIDLYIKEAAYLGNGDFAVICYCNSGYDADKMITNISNFEIGNGDGVLIAKADFNDVNVIIPAMGGVEHRFNFPVSEDCVVNSDVELSELTWSCDVSYSDIPAIDINDAATVDSGYVPSTDPAAYNDAMRIKTYVGGTENVRTAWQNASYTTTDANVATVDANGTIHAVGVGTAVITASSGTLHSDKLVIVADADVYTDYKGSNLLTKWMTLGEFTKINTAWESSTFSSDNASVVTVSADGRVTAVGKGGAAVTNTSTLGTETVYYYIVF